MTKCRDDCGEAVAAWNALAADVGLMRCSRLTAKRRTRLVARLAEAGLAGWRPALDRVRASPGLQGANGTGFQATFDWLVGEDGFARVIEGVYAGWKGKPGDGGGEVVVNHIDNIDDLRGRLADGEIEVLRKAGASVQQLRTSTIGELHREAGFQLLKAADMPDDDILRLLRDGLTFAKAEAYFARRNGEPGAPAQAEG